MQAMPSVLAISTVAVLSAILTPGLLTNVPHPTQGHEQGSPVNGWDIVFPLQFFQCEPALIYFNITTDLPVFATLTAPDALEYDEFRLITLIFPQGIGYLEWICNIPAGFTFITFPVTDWDGGYDQSYTVQPGSSSACLQSITTTYSYITYNTANFQTYTHSFNNFTSTQHFQQ
jgi:hypothetical protein